MYRTIEQAYELIRQNDPETAITKYYIRKLATRKLIRTLENETKILVDCISLQEYLGITFVIKRQLA